MSEEAINLYFNSSKQLELNLAYDLKMFVEEQSRDKHPDHMQEIHHDFLKIWNRK